MLGRIELKHDDDDARICYCFLFLTFVDFTSLLSKKRYFLFFIYL